MDQTGLLSRLRSNWGWMVVRGVAAVLFGIATFAAPGATLLLLVIFWGAFAIVDGLCALVGAFRMHDEGRPMWPLAVVGLAGLAAGLFAFLQPGLTAVGLLICIAIWAIATGFFQIVAAIRIRKVIENEWMLILSGALSIGFGLLMLARPGAGAVAIAWLIAAYVTLAGLILIGLGMRLRSLPAGR
ncbi:MAG TPA: HdeD family acid-resistance protein [Dongiaceae bacterium]|nr:HdeD family acid-resistance protein [Dongiaceae bacterium]